MVPSPAGCGREGEMKIEVMAVTNSKRKARLGLNARWAWVLMCKVAASEALVRTTMGAVFSTGRVGKAAGLRKAGAISGRGLINDASTKVVSLNFLQILNLLSCLRDSL
jgi:hypothetical protein